MAADQQTAPTAAAGKYLTFGLAGENYGLEILRVQEIVGLLPITRVPRLPNYVAGVVNLRGRVIPVVDLRLSFGLDAASLHERTCIIVVRVERAQGGSTVTGVLVDEVSDVIALSEADIEPTPEFSADVDASFVKGVGREGDRVVLLLDIDHVLTNSQLDLVEKAAAVEAAATEGDA